MRCAILLVVTCTWLATDVAARAQFSPTATPYGTFGPRALGGPLRPQERRFSNGLVFGPSGTFEGIRHTYPLLHEEDIGPVAPAWSVLRDLPPVPPQWIVPATGDLEDTMRALAAERAAPVPVPEPAVAAPRPAPPPMPELPLRRSGPTLGGETVAPEAPPAAPVPGRIGPQTVSPLETAGAPAAELHVDFGYGRAAPNRIAASLTRQLTESHRIEKLSPIRVQVVGRTAVLRGAVASKYDRRVAEEVVRMQPGISDVQNDLTVGPSR